MKRFQYSIFSAFVLFCQFFLFQTLLFSQHSKKTNTARRISAPPRIDGKIDDQCWKDLPLFDNFIQWGPYNGVPPSEKTEVRVGYDDTAIYIAGLCFDSSPHLMRAEIGSRDSFAFNAEEFAVHISPLTTASILCSSMSP